MAKYVTNKDHHYFVVEDCEGFELPDGCRYHNNLRAMYVFVSRMWGVPIDEVECQELLIKGNQYWDGRGIQSDINGSVENFISDFVM